MIFDNPGFLYLYFIFIVLIPVIVIRYRKSRVRANLFAASAPSGRRLILLKELRLRIIISEICFVLFICFIIFALSGPRWGIRIVPDHRRGIDLVLAFDLSASMNVRDERDDSSRLERALEIADDFTALLGNIRLGAAIGRGRGVLAIPLTYDLDVIHSFLNGLNPESISGSGTNLESLIDAAGLAFQDSVPSRRGIILFSDGESLSGSLQAAVERARRSGVFISAVGLGSDQGSFIPVEISSDNPDGFLLGDDGNEIISQRYAGTLRSTAERTGGFYIDGGRFDSAQILAEHINSLSSDSSISGFRREDRPRWLIFILAAIFCFFAMKYMGYGIKRTRAPRRYRGIERRARPRKEIPIISLILLLGSCSAFQGRLHVMEGNFYSVRGYYSEAISSYLRAMEFDDAAPYAEFGLGSVYFAMGESVSALERFTLAEERIKDSANEEHQELRFRLYYNRGIILFENEDYDDAAEAFRESLMIDSGRIEAKQNLELSLLSIARRGSLPSPQVQEEDENPESSVNEINAIIFEYLREMEQEQWRSREWDGENDFSGPDY